MDSLLAHAPCSFLSFDDEGRIAEVNETLLELLGFAREELEGAHIETIFTIASRIFYQTHFFPLLMLHGRAEEIFLSLRSKQSSPIPVLAYASRRGDKTQCIFVPVHQRQKYEEEILAAKRAAEAAGLNNEQLVAAQQQLQAQAQELERKIRKAEQNNRELLQVTKILFHDLREPIRKIETFASLIAREAPLDEQCTLYLSRISAASTRMAILLQALQQFVSVEAHDEKLHPVNLNAAVAEAFRMTAEMHPQCVADFHADDLPVVDGFQAQLHMLFLHLLDNAFKFRASGNHVRIRLEATLLQQNTFQFVKSRYRYADFVQIRLRDYGVGIPEDYREAVFQLLRKLDSSDAHAGCGLAICRKVIENHYGNISIIPTEGQGTTFQILLPLQQE